MSNGHLQLIESRTVDSESDTVEFAIKLIDFLKPGITLGLVGNLGAGKTTLTRAVLSKLGVTEEVPSPTFVLQQEYQVNSELNVEHWDLYRLNSLPEELYSPPPAKTLRIVEWPDRIPQMMQQLDLIVSIEIIDIEKGKRRFDLSKIALDNLNT